MLKIRKIIVAFLTLVIFSVTVLPSVGTAASNQTKFTLKFVDSTGNVVSKVNCSAFAYDDDGSLVSLGSAQADKNGAFTVAANLDSISKREKNKYVHLTVKASADGKMPVSLHWSANPADLSDSTLSSRQVNEITLSDLPTAKSGTLKASYPPTGIFRDRLSSSFAENGKVEVGELHYVSNLIAEFTYGAYVSTKLGCGIKYGSGWAVNGGASVTVSSNNSGTKSSVGMTASQYMMAPYRFNHEYWVTEEEDGDIWGLWHVVSSWEEIIPSQYLGGLNGGTTVLGLDGTPPQGDIVSIGYGEIQTVGNNDDITYSGNWKYSIITLSASVHYKYNRSIKYYNGEQGNIYETFRPYGQPIWYATRISQ